MRSEDVFTEALLPIVAREKRKFVFEKRKTVRREGVFASFAISSLKSAFSAFQRATEQVD